MNKQNIGLSNSSKNTRNEILDFFKGIAILLIIAVHMSQVYNLPVPFKKLCEFGQMGTSVFFVASGFCLMKSQDNKHLRVRQFYINRWLSIAPGYYFAVLFFFLWNLAKLHIGTGLGIGFYIKGSIVNLLLLNGLIPAYNNSIVPGGWFVGTTVLIYWIFPLLTFVIKKLIKSKKQKLINSYFFPFFSCLILSLITGLINYSQTGMLLLKNNSFLYFSVMNQLPCFLCGVVLFYRVKDKTITVNYKYIAFACVLYVISFLLFHSSFSIRFYILPYMVALATSVLLEYLLVKNKKGNGIVNTLGKESYGIYLIHSIFAYQLSSVVEKILGLNNFFLFVPMYIVIVLISLFSGKCINKMSAEFRLFKYK